MRYALLSDIHSNLESLQQVFHSLRNESIDSYLCLGDIIGYGADPNECVDLISRSRGVCVAGNHDRVCTGGLPEEYFNDYAREAAVWTRERLDPGAKAYLKGLDLVYSEGSFAMVHGTLDEPAAFEYMLYSVNAAKTFPLMSVPVCFVGHTHVSGTFIQDPSGRITYNRDVRIRIRDDFKYIVNVGSVGQPRDNDPRAACGIFDTSKMEIRIIRVDYDAGTAAEKIRKAGLPVFLAERIMWGH